MTTIELSHREWLQQGKILATQQRYLESDAAAHSSALPPESSIDLRHYDTRRLGYSITRHPAAQLERSRTSGGVSPLQPRDVLRSSGSMFFCTESDASGLPHAEAKLAAFKHKYVMPFRHCIIVTLWPGTSSSPCSARSPSSTK